MLRELDSRESDGITVTLFWNDFSDSSGRGTDFSVTIIDEKNDLSGSFSFDNFKQARDAYFHPFAVLPIANLQAIAATVVS